jgi:hypothetical protein
METPFFIGAIPTYVWSTTVLHDRFHPVAESEAQACSRIVIEWWESYHWELPLFTPLLTTGLITDY